MKGEGEKQEIIFRFLLYILSYSSKGMKDQDVLYTFSMSRHSFCQTIIKGFAITGSAEAFFVRY